MSPAALRKLALSLPGSYEEPHFDRASFRVNKRIFATMPPSGKEAMVKLTPDEALSLIEGEGDVFFAYGGFTTAFGALGVRLDRVPDDLLKDLVAQAWRRRASSRELALWDQGTPAPKAKASKGRPKSSPPARKRAPAKKKARSTKS
jgi:hypothetical protein